MADDTDRLLDATTALVPALLDALDGLAWAGRHLHPPVLDRVAAEVAGLRPPLAAGLERFRAESWPAHLEGFRAHVSEAAGLALRALDGLAGAAALTEPALAAYRAIGLSTRAIETLYPVAAMLPPVSRFFVHERYRDDEALGARLAAADHAREDTGVMHAANSTDERGGFSLYVPEYYDAARAYPLIVALHGGSGHGRSFLWTWLRDARTRGAIVLSPSSNDRTWSLMGPDVDSANLDQMVANVKSHWNVDAGRVLLTGMSDGGTFGYLTGLRDDAPFTHLAPSSASFHPMLLELASADRLRGLPVYLMHGALDWMFPVEVARMARDAFTVAGAAVVYREIENLSHTWPREESIRVLDWLLA
jgi:phospholipase/carboxylesterase